MNPYRSYRRLPSLAGVCSMADAMKPGLAVEQCVARLKRYHYVFKRLHQIFTARITAEPIYELKTAFSLHAWLCAEHVKALRDRKSTRLNSSHLGISYAVFCLKKKKTNTEEKK